MCLPFCCGGSSDDQGSPSPGAGSHGPGTGMATTHGRTGHGDGHSPDPPIHPSTGEKEPNNGKGSMLAHDVSENEEGFKSEKMDSPPVAQKMDTKINPAMQQAPEAVQASKPRDRKTAEAPEHGDQVFTVSTTTPATKVSKQLEHASDGPHYHKPLPAAPQPKDKGTDTMMRTPPSAQQIARRGGEDDHYSIAPPTAPIPPAAANNGHGDRGHDDDQTYGGNDGDRKPPAGKSRLG